MQEEEVGISLRSVCVFPPMSIVVVSSRDHVSLQQSTEQEQCREGELTGLLVSEGSLHYDGTDVMEQPTLGCKSVRWTRKQRVARTFKGLALDLFPPARSQYLKQYCGVFQIQTTTPFHRPLEDIFTATLHPFQTFFQGTGSWLSGLQTSRLQLTSEVVSLACLSLAFSQGHL